MRPPFFGQAIIGPGIAGALRGPGVVGAIGAGASGGDPLLALFAGGFLLDRQTNQFQTTTNATPATADTNPVGLWLDRSAGLALGSDVVVNGGFDSDTVWSKGTGWTIAGGVASFTATGSNASLTQAGILVAGRYYEITVTATVAAGSIAVRLGGGVTGDTVGTITESGTYTYRGIAGITAGATSVVFSVFTTTTCTIDNVSCREIAGRHAYQGASTSFRPTRTGSGTAINLDGSDDRLNTLHVPGAAGTLIARVSVGAGAAGRVIMGSITGAVTSRCFLSVTAGGLAAGIASQSTAVITGGSDIRGTTGTGAVTWDGTTVRLYWNAVQVYSGAQIGSAEGTQPIDLGALNNNGTQSSFFPGTARAFGAAPRALTASEILTVHNRWSN
jgi:hypothetical protein